MTPHFIHGNLNFAEESGSTDRTLENIGAAKPAWIPPNFSGV